jgi:Ca2+-binding RTX toxin-like protein
MAVVKNGTDLADIITITGSDIPGGTFDGKGGNDTLQLAGQTSGPWALEFDLTQANSIVNFETIRGSTTTDYITLSGNQLASIAVFDAGGTGYKDYLWLKGSEIDLRDKSIIGPMSISLRTSGTVVTVNDKSIAMKIDGSLAANDHLILKGISLSLEERSTLHDNGIDIITDDSSAKPSRDLAPVLGGLSEVNVLIRSGVTTYLDVGFDASVSDEKTLAKMDVKLDHWSGAEDVIGLDTSGAVKIIPGTFYDDVFVDSVKIGQLQKHGSLSWLSFTFNDEATAQRVQTLIRSLTIKDDRTYLPHGHNKVEVNISDKGGRVAEAFIDLLYGNDAPTNISLSGITVREQPFAGTLIGIASGTDPNDGDKLKFSLANDAEGRFAISSTGILTVRDPSKIDYEAAKAHTITIRVTDLNGLTYDKSFTISVLDYVYDDPNPDPDDVPDTPMYRPLISGTIGNDALMGDLGRNRMFGAPGNDILDGKGGADILHGNAGNDTLTGGSGNDIFVFDTKPNRSTNKDRILDFGVADDTIWLDNYVFAKLGRSGSENKPALLKKDFFVVGSKAKDKNDYVVYDKAKGVLLYDSDGSGRGKAIEIATLSKKLAMTHKDFFVI